MIPRSLDVIFKNIEGLHYPKSVSHPSLFHLARRLTDPPSPWYQLKLVGSASVEFQNDEEGEAEERPTSNFLLGKGKSVTLAEGCQDSSEQCFCSPSGFVLISISMTTALDLDKNYSYAVFLSYAEVYTDKVGVYSSAFQRVVN